MQEALPDQDPSATLQMMVSFSEFVIYSCKPPCELAAYSIVALLLEGLAISTLGHVGNVCMIM